MRPAPHQPQTRPLSFLGGIWHGAFLAASLALSDINVVVPALITELTGSSIWVGGFAALIAAAGAAPQVVVARFVEPLARKRPVLLGAIYLRVASLAGLGWFVSAAGKDRPDLIFFGLAALLGLFAAGGALGNVPFTDLVGRVIPKGRRGAFFASRQATGSVLALGASVIAGIVLTWSYPTNYAALFLLSAAALAVASAGIWLVREPPARPAHGRLAWTAYLRSLRAPLRALWPGRGDRLGRRLPLAVLVDGGAPRRRCRHGGLVERQAQRIGRADRPGLSGLPLQKPFSRRS